MTNMTFVVLKLPPPVRGEDEFESRPQNEIVVFLEISYEQPSHFYMKVPLFTMDTTEIYFYWSLIFGIEFSYKHCILHHCLPYV